MRVVFMGTPDFAVPTLARLARTATTSPPSTPARPPRPAAAWPCAPRPSTPWPTRLGVPVLTPATLRTPEAAETSRRIAADVAVVVAYGMLLPQAILDAPRHGCLNLHGSLLPRWRGAAPIQRAVMAGDAESGVGVMRMEAGLDTGPVALEARLPDPPGMTAGDLARRADAGRRRPDGAGPRRSGRRHAGLHAAAGGRRASTRTRSPTRRRGSTGPGRRVEVATQINGLSPVPRRLLRDRSRQGAERVKVLRAPTAEGAGAPGRCSTPKAPSPAGTAPCGSWSCAAPARAAARAAPSSSAAPA